MKLWKNAVERIIIQRYSMRINPLVLIAKIMFCFIAIIFFISLFYAFPNIMLTLLMILIGAVVVAIISAIIIGIVLAIAISSVILGIWMVFK